MLTAAATNLFVGAATVPAAPTVHFSTKKIQIRSEHILTRIVQKQLTMRAHINIGCIQTSKSFVQT